jgi:heme-degrading monooxygenase HmoA
MIAIARFEVSLAHSANFRTELEAARDALAECVGYIDGSIGQNLDQPSLWVLMTRWENVGSYRRALSAMRSKLEAIPVLARAIDEPGAYE